MLRNLLNDNAYIKINLIFIILILLIFCYSWAFPWLEAKKLTVNSNCFGYQRGFCKSIGSSRAFSQIIRLNIQEALILNKYSLNTFVFFLVQLFSRFIFSLAFLKRKGVVSIDIGF